MNQSRLRWDQLLPGDLCAYVKDDDSGFASLEFVICSPVKVVGETRTVLYWSYLYCGRIHHDDMVVDLYDVIPPIGSDYVIFRNGKQICPALP